MKEFLGAAAALLLLSHGAAAQTEVEVKLPELPAPAGQEAKTPDLPAPSNTYNPVPAFAPPSDPPPAPSAPQRKMSEEEINRLKQDENWLVEAMKQKQMEEEAAKAKQYNDPSAKKDSSQTSSSVLDSKPGDFGTFKPVLSDNSVGLLNPANKDSKEKKDPFLLNAGMPVSNPVNTADVGTVQPILGPKSQPQNYNSTQQPFNNGIAPLPGTNTKKISSNPNFVPDGYVDSWSLQQKSPYPNLTPQAPQKPLPPPAPSAPRPTFRDLANTLPDPASIR